MAASFSCVTPNQELTLPVYPSSEDCQLCLQVVHGRSGAAEIPGHLGVYGAQQSGPVPEGGAGDHYWPAHASSSRVQRAGVPLGLRSELVGLASEITHHQLQ